MKRFNNAGPSVAADNYIIDPLRRIREDEVETLIDEKRYFILHAPRQTGKTTCLLALRDFLNAKGDYVCVYANIEAAQAARNNVQSVIATVCGTIARELNFVLGSNLGREVLTRFETEEPNLRLTDYLTELSIQVGKPLVLMLDEIDALVGDGLVSVLRQIRAGYANRPMRFPHSIILCGIRDVRDYRIVTSNREIVTGGSAFNIKAESLRLGDFTQEEIRELYQQHTDATGQVFDEACFPLIWRMTEGQPWLVNSVGREVTYKMRENRDPSVRIVPAMVDRAIELLIYRRDTHIDQLIDKLKEPRVKRVIEPILVGEDTADDGLFPADDLQYCVDLGLIKRDKPIRISNGIYQEVIPRELTWTTQSVLPQQPQWFRMADGRIDMQKLLLDFQQFFRQNADSWIGKFDYAEAGPQLLLQAFLQRVVNGGGFIDREYGLGRGRTDLLIRQPLTNTCDGPVQRIVLELKIRRNSLERTIADGLRQTWEYMDRCGSVDEGHFILFDRTVGKSWEERIWHEVRDYNGHRICVWGL